MIDIDKLIKESLKSGDGVKLRAYRNIKAKIQKSLSAKGCKDRTITEEVVTNAIKKELKELKEEIKFISVLDSAIYKSLSAQIVYVSNLLPAPLRLDEHIEACKEGIERAGERFGDIMKYIKSTGKPFDMKTIVSELKKML